jgi:MFS family permease
MADKLGVRRVIAVSFGLLAIIWIAFSFTEQYWHHRAYFITVSMLEAFLMNVGIVSFFSLAMAVSWPKVAATQFTAYMATLNLSTVIASRIEPLMINDAYYEINLLFYKNIFHWPGMSIPQIYLVVGIFQIAFLVMLPFIDPHQTRRVLGDETE